MALSDTKTKLEAAIKAALDKTADKGKNTEQIKSEFAKDLTEAINAYITSAEVVVDDGIEVKTTGNETAQSGKTTAKGKGSLK